MTTPSFEAQSPAPANKVPTGKSTVAANSNYILQSESIALEPSDVQRLIQVSNNSMISEDLEDSDVPVKSLLPPLRHHYPVSTVLFYRLFSSISSSFFLIFGVLFWSILKMIPSMCWTLWSWCRFKDPDSARPFYEKEKARKHIKSGRLKCDIGYYAERVGLKCDESRIETEDGFILTMHHIIDPSPEAVDCKSTNTVPDLTDNFR